MWTVPMKQPTSLHMLSHVAASPFSGYRTIRLKTSSQSVNLRTGHLAD